MRELTLNFSGEHSRVQRTGRALLLVSLVFAGSVFWRYESIQQELSAIQEQRSRWVRSHNESGAQRRHEESAPERVEEMKYANKVIDRLALPWDRLFNEMENSVNSDVVLLGVEPDAGRGRITFTSEARDLSTMLSYEQRLAQSALLREVHIQSHQMQMQDPQKPVRFIVGADWLPQAGVQPQ